MEIPDYLADIAKNVSDDTLTSCPWHFSVMIVYKQHGMWASTCHDDETRSFHKHEAERARSRTEEK